MGYDRENSTSSGGPLRPQPQDGGARGAPGKHTLTEGLAPAADPPRGAAGSPLPPEVRGKMEGAFATDLGAVRVHEDGAAGAMGARAFTRGTDIHVASGELAAGTQAGQELIGHELAHVVQQAEGRVAAQPQAKGDAAGVNADPALESEADQMGERAARGEQVRSAPVSLGPAGGVVQAKLSARLNFAQLADQIFRAVDGLGTDEEAVYAALGALDHDAENIAALESAYRRYGDLRADLEDDFSGSELARVHALLTPRAQPAPQPAGGSTGGAGASSGGASSGGATAGSGTAGSSSSPSSGGSSSAPAKGDPAAPDVTPKDGGAGAKAAALGPIPAKPKIADIGQAGWMTIIPDAVAKDGATAQTPKVSGHKHAKGQFTNFDDGKQTYATDKQGNELATAGALAGGVDQAKVDAEVARITAARAAIHARHFVDGGAGYAGVVSMPQYENAKKDQESADAAKGYQGWLKTAAPSMIKDPKEPHWQIYKTLMGWEGDPSTINAYDQVNVTWGSGFSGAGPVMELILRAFQKSPEIKAAFFNAGVTIGDDGNFCVVDPDKKWKLHGADAQLYVRTHQELLAMMVNCAQGVFQSELANRGSDSPDPRQAVLDANFETFMTGAGRSIPANVLGWTTNEAALAAHSVHAAPGIYHWSELSKLDPHSTTDLAQFIYDKSHSWFAYVVPVQWRDAVKKDPPAAPKTDK